MKNEVKKFKLTDEKIELFGFTLYRIQALIDIPSHGVKAGDLGGFVESEKNLSHEGECWVADNALVYGKARVYRMAYVFGNSRVYEYAHVCGKARVYGTAQVFGNAFVCDNAKVFGKAQVYEDARVYGKARIYGNARFSEGFINCGILNKRGE